MAKGRPLYGVQALFGVEYALLEFLELGRDVPLGLCQGLLADPLLRDFVFVRVPDLEVVPKDVVECDLQRRDARGLHFADPDPFKLGFAVVPQVAQFVELLHHTCGDGGPFAQDARGVVRELIAEPFQCGIGGVQPAGPASNDGVVGAVHNEPQSLYRGQCAPQPIQFGGRNADRCRLGQQAFEVPDAAQFRDKVCAHGRLCQEGGQRLRVAW